VFDKLYLAYLAQGHFHAALTNPRKGMPHELLRPLQNPSNPVGDLNPWCMPSVSRKVQRPAPMIALKLRVPSRCI